MTTAIAPAPPQHMRALEQANRVRLARAEIKRQVAEGEQTVADVIRGHDAGDDGLGTIDWAAESMAIFDLLMCQHRWGRSRSKRFLRTMQMLETKTIGSMTKRQRNELIRRLEGTYEDPDPIVVVRDEPLAEKPPAEPEHVVETTPDALTPFAKMRAALQEPEPDRGSHGRPFEHNRVG